MSKPIGMNRALLAGGLTYVASFRTGKFWFVNSSGKDSPYYNVTHIPSGKKIIGYVGIRRAKKMVGVLDALMPCDTEEKLSNRWHQFPVEVQRSLLEDSV